MKSFLLGLFLLGSGTRLLGSVNHMIMKEIFLVELLIVLLECFPSLNLIFVLCSSYER